MYYCANENNINTDIQEKSSNYIAIKRPYAIRVCFRNYILRRAVLGAVINFAAQSHVQNSFEDSLTYTKDNVGNTHFAKVVTMINGRKIYSYVSTDEYAADMLDVNENHKTERV